MSGFYSLHVQGSTLAILYGGVSLTSAATSIDFEGAGQTTTVIGNEVTVTIPGGAFGTPVIGETPTGAVNGVNVTYILVHSPVAGTVALYYGLRLVPTTDFSVSGNTITMTQALLPGSTVVCDYEY